MIQKSNNQTIPNDIKSIVEKAFVKKKAYAQIYTSGDPHPWPRTVHVHYLPERSCFSINTHTHSQKWVHINEKSKLYGCYWDEEQQIQFSWEAVVSRLNTDCNESTEFQNSMWNKMREEVRLAYHLEDLGESMTKTPVDPALSKKMDLNLPTQTHGIIEFLPSIWDVYQIKAPHRMGEKYIYAFQNNIWTKKTSSILHSPNL